MTLRDEADRLADGIRGVASILPGLEPRLPTAEGLDAEQLDALVKFLRPIYARLSAECSARYYGAE